MSVVILGFRFAIASIFAAAAFSKATARSDFVEAVRNYRLTPASWANPIALLLPAVELGAAVLLTVGLGIRPVASLLSLLLLVFAGAVAINLARGREIDCGCFGTGSARRMTWWTVARNIGLAAIATVVAYQPPGALSLDRALGVADSGGIAANEAIAVAITSVAGLAAVAITLQALRLWSAMRTAGSGAVR